MLSLGYKDWNEVVGWDYAEEIRQKHVLNNIVNLELTNCAEDGTVWTKSKKYCSDCYFEKYIDPELLEIKNDLLITQDSIYFYSIYNNDIFWIEIQYRQIAKSQAQMFWLAWEKGIDMKPFEKFQLP